MPLSDEPVAGKLPIPLVTPRLALRRFRATDQGDLLDLMRSEEAFPYTDWQPMDEGDVCDWLRKDQGTSIAAPDGCLRLALEIHGRPNLIGYADLGAVSDNPGQGSFIIIIAPPLRNLGYGTEAAQAVLKLAFRTVKFRRVAVAVDCRNLPAKRLLEKLGMRREGEFVKDWCVRGHWTNSLWYALLADELVKGITQ